MGSLEFKEYKGRERDVRVQRSRGCAGGLVLALEGREAGRLTCLRMETGMIGSAANLSSMMKKRQARTPLHPRFS
jgi:hypothetical protein